MQTDHNHPATANIPLPRLSDDAVVQVHDFINHFLDLFEGRYGDQIQSRPTVAGSGAGCCEVEAAVRWQFQQPQRGLVALV